MFKTTAARYVAAEVCDVRSHRSTLKAEMLIGMVEEKITLDEASLIINNHIHDIVDHVYANNTVSKFCRNAAKGKW